MGGGQVTSFFLHIFSSWVKIRLHTKNPLPRLPGSALKFSVGGGFQPIMWSHQPRLRLRLGCDNMLDPESWEGTKMMFQLGPS